MQKNAIRETRNREKERKMGKNHFANHTVIVLLHIHRKFQEIRVALRDEHMCGPKAKGEERINL